MNARAQRLALAGTAAAIAVTRLVPLAKGPWDWDEVLFCLAIQDYDVGLHQPHPPGFPLYIFLARIARFFADSDFHALQTVNVIAGMLAFPVMYAVARSFRMDFVMSFWAAVLFAFLPNVWFFGGTAFSDLPAAMFFLAAIAAFMYAAHGGNARTYLGASVLLAAALMVRPQNVPVALFPWAFASWRFVREGRRRVVIAGAGVTAGLTLFGYFLAAWATGFESWALALFHHAMFVRATDSIAAERRLSILDSVLRMLDPYAAGKVSLLINFLALAGIVLAVVRKQWEPLRSILLTFGTFFVFAWLAVNPLGSSRFSLNWIAGVVLLAALGVHSLVTFAPRLRTPAFAVMLLVILGRLIPWTLPAFEQPHDTDAPPVAAAKWVAANTPRSSVVYVDESIWPWAKYFIPNHEQVRPQGQANIVRDRRAIDGVFISMDPTLMPGELTFRRPRNRTWNLVVQRAFEASVVPARSVASFDHGWYPLEGDYPNVWRWSSKRASIRFPPSPAPSELHLVFEAPVEIMRRPVRVAFKLNGKSVATYVAATKRNEVRYLLAPRADRVNVLTVEVSDTFIPSQLRMSDDWRQLGIMLRSWEWRPLRSSSPFPASPASASPRAPRTARALAPRSLPGRP